MTLCPLCPRPLSGKRKHCPICQAKRENARRWPKSPYGPGQHPNSKKNLVSGRQPASRLSRFEKAQKGGKARAEKSMSQMQRDILRKYGKKGLACFRMGRRVGYQAAYYRWHKWAQMARRVA